MVTAKLAPWVCWIHNTGPRVRCTKHSKQRTCCLLHALDGCCVGWLSEYRYVYQGGNRSMGVVLVPFLALCKLNAWFFLFSLWRRVEVKETSRIWTYTQHLLALCNWFTRWLEIKTELFKNLLESLEFLERRASHQISEKTLKTNKHVHLSHQMCFSQQTRLIYIRNWWN